VDSVPETKRCGKCGEVKAASEFYKNRATKSGLTSSCKACFQQVANSRKERIKVTKAAWHQRNKAKKVARDKELYALDPERFRVRNRRWRERNLEKARQSAREWTRRNREACRNQLRIYRARKFAAPGVHFTDRQFAALCKQYENRCLCCGREDVKLTADHVVPLSRGGADDIGNIQPLCARCNQGKCDRTIDYRPAAKGIQSVQLAMF
jgi:5-methylcytosine-specific restriction endonuclease McrA